MGAQMTTGKADTFEMLKMAGKLDKAVTRHQEILEVVPLEKAEFTRLHGAILDHSAVIRGQASGRNGALKEMTERATQAQIRAGSVSTSLIRRMARLLALTEFVYFFRKYWRRMLVILFLVAVAAMVYWYWSDITGFLSRIYNYMADLIASLRVAAPTPQVVTPATGGVP